MLLQNVNFYSRNKRNVISQCDYFLLCIDFSTVTCILVSVYISNGLPWRDARLKVIKLKLCDVINIIVQTFIKYQKKLSIFPSLG